MNLGGRRLFLASTSRYRRALIERLGLGVELIEPPLDEDLEKQRVGPMHPSKLAEHLARAKARSVTSAGANALVIGGDQVAVVGDEVLHKPVTLENAVAQLATLSGVEHRLYTAVAVCDPSSGVIESALDVHRLTMRTLSRDEIEDYARRDDALDCAGSYRIESLGISLFAKVQGDDPTAVMGMPLTLLTALLSRFGVKVLG